MTRKLFWTDPYLTAVDTQVSDVAGDDIMLEATIFYALSGGQESDHGTIAGRDVVQARWQDRDIVYTLTSDHGLAIGDTVTIAIDWPRRYRLMRLHFAAELVLELAYAQHEGIDKIGAHIAADKARIDFAWPHSIKPALPLLENEANQIVARDQSIISAFSDEASERRYWQLDGFARVPCGGTHLRTTGEVGGISLKRNNIGGGKERIEIRVTDI